MRITSVLPTAAAVLSATLSAAPAIAETPVISTPKGGYVVIPVEDLPPIEHGADISKTIFLNRCAGGCTIQPGSNNARENTSSIVNQTSTFTEFEHGDEAWQAVMDCVAEVYRPFDVEVTDVDPGELFHHEAIVAGTAAEAGLPANTGGVAPLAGDCRAINNVISFSFANQAGGSIDSIVAEVCWTVAQETAHAFGLDHEYHCSDPMTYVPGCFTKYFRDVSFDCGENGARTCQCGGNKQNSHRKLLNVFGPGAGAYPPTTSILLPNDNDTVARGDTVFFESSDVRGIRRVELVINGYKWDQKTLELDDGDPTDQFPRSYDNNFNLPGGLPDGYQDVEIRAYNDVDVMASDKITVLIGSPCQNADTCLDGQNCNDGRCAWPTPTGELGDACARDQDCVSDLCPDNGGDKRCSEFCVTNITGACGDGFECLGIGQGTTGVCWPLDEGGGCCSIGGDHRAPYLELLLFGAIIAVVVRRRR